MLPEKIHWQRLHKQSLIDSRFTTPEAVVSWLGAVQAQDYYGAKWSLGMRMLSSTDDVIEQAFNDGRILRTHMMRPTWHFVTPEDIRWIMRLTSHRVHTMNAYHKRQLELDETTLKRTNDLIAKALEGGHYLTRKELGEKLAESGIEANGQCLAYIMMQAELDLLVCSGPRRGKQFTYALLDERAGAGKNYEGDEALAEFTKRYFMGHGPATESDFSWWSGFTLTEAREGINLINSSLDCIDLHGERYYFLQSMLSETTGLSKAHLLPTFDEFYVGYTDYSERISAGQRLPKNNFAQSPVIIGEKIVGTWRRTVQKSHVEVLVTLFASLNSSEMDVLNTEIQRFGNFLGLPVKQSIISGNSK